MMNKEEELDMNDLIRDFNEYSTDYSKTACRYYEDYLINYQKEKLDLQQRIDKAIEYINKAQLPMNDEYLTEFDCGVELLEILGGKE